MTIVTGIQAVFAARQRPNGQQAVGRETFQLQYAFTLLSATDRRSRDNKKHVNYSHVHVPVHVSVHAANLAQHVNLLFMHIYLTKVPNVMRNRLAGQVDATVLTVKLGRLAPSFQSHESCF